MSREPADLRYALACTLGLLAFWLPWIKTGIFGSFNGYQIFMFLSESNLSLSLALIALPLLFLFLGAQRLFSFTSLDARLLKLLELLTLLMALLPNAYLTIRAARRPGVELTLEHFTAFFSYGIVLTLMCGAYLSLSARKGLLKP